jgi:peptidoglycan-associated lipoprotein
MPRRSFVGFTACLLALGGCIAEPPSQALNDPGQTLHCVASDFGVPKGHTFSQKRRRLYVLPPEIEQIHRGVYEQAGSGELIYERTWVGVDFDRNQAIRVERIFGVLYGPAIAQIAQTQTDYVREEPDWVEIVSIRTFSNGELDALACPANDLWLNDRNERNTSMGGVSSELTLRDGEAEKTFAGDGRSDGDAGAYGRRLNDLVPRNASGDMDLVRSGILHDGGYGFTTDIGNQVLFDSDASKLTPAAKDQLDRWTYYLIKRPQLRLLIEGHADDPGSNEHNKTLARRRAAAAKDYLAKHGVDPLRIETVSVGKAKPAVLGPSDGARAQNRRVVGYLEQLIAY